MKKIHKIAVLTSGGDAPGMNAAIRAIVRSGINNGLEVYGVYNGYLGLVQNDIRPLTRGSVTNIINRGGTILGTARLPEFADMEVTKKGADNLKKLGIDALVVIGGDGTYRGAKRLHDLGIHCVGIPGTIDNDIASSEITIGFDTAVNTAVECIDKLRDTSNSHQRCSIIEVMGRHCGDIAYAAGVAGGCDLIVTSETGYTVERVMEVVNRAKEQQRRHILIVFTEHITDVDALAKKIKDETGFDSRATILGHIQRGGIPTPFDRVLATRFGVVAVQELLAGNSGIVLGLQHNEIVPIEIEESFKMTKNIFRKYAVEVNTNASK